MSEVLNTCENLKFCFLSFGHPEIQFMKHLFQSQLAEGQRTIWACARRNKGNEDDKVSHYKWIHWLLISLAPADERAAHLSISILSVDPQLTDWRHNLTNQSRKSEVWTGAELADTHSTNFYFSMYGALNKTLQQWLGCHDVLAGAVYRSYTSV